jgi:hypothetical protein
MSIFILLLISGISCSSLDFEINSENLYHSFRTVARLYSMKQNDPSFNFLFFNSVNKLISFIDGHREKELTKLFTMVREIGKFYLSNFVILMVSIGCPQVMPWERETGWKEIIQDDPFNLFLRSKRVMNFLIKKEDWTNTKETLQALLLIQRQFLHLLKGDEIKYQRAKLWIEEFEIIYYSFEPGNLNRLIRLFYKIESLSHKYDIPDFKDRSKFPILKSIKLFKVYCYQYYHRDWARIKDVKSVPRPLLYLILAGRSNFSVFKSLKYPSPKVLFLNMDFYKVIFTCAGGPCIMLSSCHLKETAELYRFMRKWTECENGHPNLGEKENWFMKCLLHIIPIFNLKFHQNLSADNKTALSPSATQNVIAPNPENLN